MSPRTLGLLLLSVSSALALAGTWLMLVLPAESEAESARLAAAQTLNFTSAATQGLVGESFVTEARAARQRLEDEETTLRAWVDHQYSEVDQFSSRMQATNPDPAAFKAACEFDCDELRREISALTGREPPRPSSWPLHLPEFQGADSEADVARMRRDQQRMNLQRLFLLAAARCRAVPSAPTEFRMLPRATDAMWAATEVQLHLAVEATGLQSLARILLAPGLPLRLRLVRFEFAPPTAEAQAAAQGTPLLLVEARIVVERLWRESDG
ncbi:MAG: hypothetical protein EXS14_03845 [Planctomycetes bacterium]|nr:hypothetical protein [Planctomycetota bacterium]